MKEILYKNGFFVVDNFLPKEMCDSLREYALDYDDIENFYLDYYAVNYSAALGCKNKKLSELVGKIIPTLIKQRFPFLSENGHDYQRGWYFIHDSHQSQSVIRHIDRGSYITANLWVTPEEYQEDFSGNYNGFIIHTPYESVTIPYKFNRLTMFFSELEHESQLSKFQKDDNKRKVNFTFLFGINAPITKAFSLGELDFEKIF